jgi:hypothetical protein
MISELISSYVPFLVAAAILVPAVVAHLAMFAESIGERKWKPARAA